MADGSLGCLHPSRPLRKAAPTTEKSGVCHPGGRHPKTSQWSQSVPPSATRGKVPSHIFPEMPTPKWLVTRRWTGLGQSPWPHPFLSGFLRRNQAQENSSVYQRSVHPYIEYILLAGGGQVQEAPRDCMGTEGGLGPSASFRGWCPGKLLLLVTRALPF